MQDLGLEVVDRNRRRDARSHGQAHFRTTCWTGGSNLADGIRNRVLIDFPSTAGVSYPDIGATATATDQKEPLPLVCVVVSASRCRRPGRAHGRRAGPVSARWVG